MNRSFFKMHGLGNDFVVMDSRADNFVPDEPLRRKIADRHRGVGCDQLIVLLPKHDPDADLFMRIYNPDGSEAGACGNATRCVGHLLFQETGHSKAIIQTISGLLKVSAEKSGSIAVDFGPPHLKWKEIPLAQEVDTLEVPVSAGDLANPCCVGMGNPHAVFFVENAEAVPLEVTGPKLEKHAMFPRRCNIEVAQIVDKQRIRMRVWERGAGITQACGSGACATLVAAVRRGLSARRAVIVLDGGELTIEWRESDGHVLMSGPATLAFRGTFAELF
ncbi:MAG: diaminopimelate epimerase [Alphaproteobacteria bacterium]|nr:diaminopimelate epimerase [Alphaproteobacteria bacterium]